MTVTMNTDKLLGALKSRTVWTVVAMFVLNNMVDIKAVLPNGWMPYTNLAMALAAIYFRMNLIQPMPTAEKKVFNRDWGKGL